MVPGRNDPCPCGSGKKYKKCCLGREGTGPFNSTKADEFAGLYKALEGQKFSSLQEAQAFTDHFMQQCNQTAREEFHGISPEQMHQFLYFPFKSPHLVSFPDQLNTIPSAPILSLSSLLVDAIGVQGLKPTAKGNLPQKFCREAALAYWGVETYRHKKCFGGINREEDFIELNVTRFGAELTGLIRKYKGKFILSRDCRRLMAEMGLAAVYSRLFKAYVKHFNWEYWDRYPDISFIQDSFLFTLYLLSRYGDRWRPHHYYEDCFLRAFPILLSDVGPSTSFTPEQRIRSCYTLRTLIRLARFLGMAEVESLTKEPYAQDYRIMKRPLLDEAVRFHFQR